MPAALFTPAFFRCSFSLAVTGIFFASEAQMYWRLLEYLARLMPNSAFLLVSKILDEIRAGASGGKLSFGLVLALWTSSSGIAALIEALNVAFEVPASRSWWHRRLVAMALTLSIGGLLAFSLLFLFATSFAGSFFSARLPILNAVHGMSIVVLWAVDLTLLFLSVVIIYAFGPNLERRQWKGILPGASLAFICWLMASWSLRLYLSTFGSLSRSYGSLAGVIALLFWLYASAAAILIGGEVNAIILKASISATSKGPERPEPKS